jgi:hypothetical protein
MKKRWIFFGLLLAAGAYYGIRHALWLRTPGLDGEFVFKNDSGGSFTMYKYGRKIISCRNGFCRVGSTRKDANALFQERIVLNDTYLYDIQYLDPEIDVPRNIRESILQNIDKEVRIYKGDKYWVNSHFETALYIEPGPFNTCAWLPGQVGCTSRTKGTERAPPKNISKLWQPPTSYNSAPKK